MLWNSSVWLSIWKRTVWPDPTGEPVERGSRGTFSLADRGGLPAADVDEPHRTPRRHGEGQVVALADGHPQPLRTEELRVVEIVAVERRDLVFRPEQHELLRLGAHHVLN